MGVASKATSVVFRIMELISAAIVVGFVGRYWHFTSLANFTPNSRIVYTEVIGGLSLVFSLLMIVPFKYQFYMFALDFIMFILWMVSFGLLRGLVGGNACNSAWYWQNWGWYWGGYQYYPNPAVITQSTVGHADCSKMLTVFAFAFIGGWFWLLSACVGIYVSFGEYHKKGRTADVGNGDFHEVREHGEAKTYPAVA